MGEGALSEGVDNNAVHKLLFLLCHCLYVCVSIEDGFTVPM